MSTRASPIESWRDKRSIGEENHSSSGSAYKAPERQKRVQTMFAGKK
jgi:hypothetical protein